MRTRFTAVGDTYEPLHAKFHSIRNTAHIMQNITPNMYVGHPTYSHTANLTPSIYIILEFRTIAQNMCIRCGVLLSLPQVIWFCLFRLKSISKASLGKLVQSLQFDNSTNVQCFHVHISICIYIIYRYIFALMHPPQPFVEYKCNVHANPDGNYTNFKGSNQDQSSA